MRTLLSLVFSTIVTMSCMAQHNTYFSFHTGIANNSLNFVNGTNIPYDDANINVLLDFRLWKEYKNHWQIGVAVENGLIQNVVDYRAFVYQNNTLVTDRAVNRQVDVLSPAFAPNVFGHYVLRLPRNNYMYGGLLAGAITGHNDMGDGKQLTSFLVGANFGITLSISKHIAFGVSHGYRYSHINMPQDIAYIVPPDGNGNYTYYELSDFDLQYFVNTISLVVRL